MTRVINRVDRFVDGRMRAAEQTMTRVLIYGASEASVLTPIDTSILLNSQYRRTNRTAKGVTGQVGYTADYAQEVHDPANPQRFRMASAEKLFLAKGFSRNRAKIDEIVKKGMRV